MKKTALKLQLSRETLLRLETFELAKAAGGGVSSCIPHGCDCALMPVAY